MTVRERIRSRSGRVSIIVGIVVAVLALVGGGAYALTQHRTWTAETMLVVLPSSDLDATNAAAYYETLSRGQIVATYAEVAGEKQFQSRATASLGLSPTQQAELTTEVTVVPDTAVLLVRTTARTADTAAQVSAATARLAVSYLGGITQGYRAVTVPTGSAAATANGFAPGVLLGAALVVALIAGLAVQQAVYHLMNAVRAGRPEEGSAATGGADGHPVWDSASEENLETGDATGGDQVTPEPSTVRQSVAHSS